MNAEKIKDALLADGELPLPRSEIAAHLDALQAERDALADKLDTSVHGHNQMFDLCQATIEERDTLLQQLEVAQQGKAECVNAIHFALAQGTEASTFLNAWLHGASDEWPEYQPVNVAGRSTNG